MPRGCAKKWNDSESDARGAERACEIEDVMANETNLVAACPKCRARYRIEAGRIGAEGVRLRCQQCDAVFRVTPPAPAAPAPAERAGPSAAVTPPAPPVTPAAESAEPSGPSAPATPPPPPVTASAGPPPRPASLTPPAAPEPPSEAAASSPPALAADAPSGEAPPAEAAAPDTSVLVADSDVDAGKRTAAALAEWGYRPLLVHDGVEAILTIQRQLPRAVVLDAALTKMFGFQVCELMKRNESLSSIDVVLVGAIHDEDRYRREPNELYGADAYLERPQLPEALRAVLRGFGLESGASGPEPIDLPASEAPAAPRAPGVDSSRWEFAEPVPAPDAAPPAPADSPTAEAPAFDPAADAAFESPDRPLFGADDADAFDAPESAGFDAPPDESVFSSPPSVESPGTDAPLVESPSLDVPLVESPPPDVPLTDSSASGVPEEEGLSFGAPVADTPVAPPADAETDEEVATAQRLARIIVSDIVLYNAERFESGLQSGDLAGALSAELAEGRSLLAQRVPARVRESRDFLVEELERVARARGGAA